MPELLPYVFPNTQSVSKIARVPEDVLPEKKPKAMPWKSEKKVLEDDLSEKIPERKKTSKEPEQGVEQPDKPLDLAFIDATSFL